MILMLSINWWHYRVWGGGVDRLNLIFEFEKRLMYIDGWRFNTCVCCLLMAVDSIQVSPLRCWLPIKYKCLLFVVGWRFNTSVCSLLLSDDSIQVPPLRCWLSIQYKCLPFVVGWRFNTSVCRTLLVDDLLKVIYYHSFLTQY